jgi:hypothetical protein
MQDYAEVPHALIVTQMLGSTCMSLTLQQTMDVGTGSVNINKYNQCNSFFG